MKDDFPDEDYADVPKALRIPGFLWKKLEEDAAKNRRSVNRLIESILLHYYDIDLGFEINIEQVNKVKYLMSRRKQDSELKRTGSE